METRKYKRLARSDFELTISKTTAKNAGKKAASSVAKTLMNPLRIMTRKKAGKKAAGMIAGEASKSDMITFLFNVVCCCWLIKAIDGS